MQAQAQVVAAPGLNPKPPEGRAGAAHHQIADGHLMPGNEAEAASLLDTYVKRAR